MQTPCRAPVLVLWSLTHSYRSPSGYADALSTTPLNKLAGFTTRLILKYKRETMTIIMLKVYNICKMRA